MEEVEVESCSSNFGRTHFVQHLEKHLLCIHQQLSLAEQELIDVQEGNEALRFKIEHLEQDLQLAIKMESKTSPKMAAKARLRRNHTIGGPADAAVITCMGVSDKNR